jgi:hypothetical protein
MMLIAREKRKPGPKPLGNRSMSQAERNRKYRRKIRQDGKKIAEYVVEASTMREIRRRADLQNISPGAFLDLLFNPYRG